GERLSVTELDRTVEYTYDSLYRLTSETITDENGTTVYTYAYDSVSNRTLKTENGAETAYVYNSLNQLVSDSDTSYEYDLNGNLVRVIGTDKSALYEYNAENKLVKATVQNGNLVTVETYTYDYAGNRTSKTTTSSNGSVEYVKYLNDNSALTNVLAEIDENGTAKCTYTIGADLISQERDGKVSVYLYDGHGSVVGLADENGVVTDTYAYDAFGNLIDSTGSTQNCYRYCGEQFDETTGLYYLRARYMDTSTGRFISQDTYQGDTNDPVSLHKYLYCNSDPVNNVDPSGYETRVEQQTCMAVLSELGKIITQNVLAVLYDFSPLIADAFLVLTAYKLTEYLLLHLKNITKGDNISSSLLDEYRSGKVKETKITEHVDTDPNRIYYVYFLRDDSGQIAYVGRTKNMEKRMAAHDKTSRGQLHLILYVSGLTLSECRWIEQCGILAFNTLYDPTCGIERSKYIGNRINGMNPKKDDLSENTRIGYSIMRIVYNEVSNEVLNFIEGGTV
ncbi:MAG: RHS repeat-associated core domain-containing protein, partial [Oscillospiraceae bacterium]